MGWLARPDANHPVDRSMNDPLMLALGELIRKEINAGQLLQRVVEVMARQLQADRGTIFILDMTTHELVSIAGHLPEVEEIRVPVDQGVAGYVARTERVVNIPYCESDQRFWRRIDQQTGYTTQSMLAGPLYDAEGDLTGVVQFLNKSNGLFNKEDEALFHTLSGQVAALLAQTTFSQGRDYTGPIPRFDDNGELVDQAPEPPLLDRFNRIIGQGQAMQAVFRNIRRAAPTDATVLLRGESGTGKSLIARALHHNSPRHAGPFVHVDCTTLPDGLMENELFGHERGAFTGAQGRQKGKVEQAQGGTLFLDEIGDLPLGLQGKLLRVIQDRAFTRLGGTELLKADIRIVAATNRDLEAAVRAGRFREDLYYRLRVVLIDLPPLRERGREDLLRLINHFVAKASRRHNRTIAGIRRDALDLLLGYHWPGNVREVENCIESAVIFADREITPSRLSLPRRHATREMQALSTAQLAAIRAAGPNASPAALAATLPGIAPVPARPHNPGTLTFSSSSHDPFGQEPTLRDLEANYIRHLLERYQGNRSACARILGIGRNTLLRKIKDYGL